MKARIRGKRKVIEREERECEKRKVRKHDERQLEELRREADVATCMPAEAAARAATSLVVCANAKAGAMERFISHTLLVVIIMA